MSKINKITPLTNVKFLNLYELEAENKYGDTHPYYVASRKNENTMMVIQKKSFLMALSFIVCLEKKLII